MKILKMKMRITYTVPLYTVPYYRSRNPTDFSIFQKKNVSLKLTLT